MGMNDLRLEIAQLAANYLREGLVESFQLAKERAAKSIGASKDADYPSNIELQKCLVENLQLMEGDVWHHRIADMRTAALAAMKFFDEFDPHLVGSVLYGTAVQDSVISIHVYSDDLESIIFKLTDANITYRLNDQTLKLPRKDSVTFPVIEIAMSEFDFDIVICALAYRFNPPISPLDGKPYLRADREKLEQLIGAQQTLFGKYFDVRLAGTPR